MIADQELKNGIYEEENVMRRDALRNQLRVWYKKRAEYWRQQSRDRYINDVDKNTKYFHVKATIRQRKGIIEAIQHRGSWLKESKRIKIIARSVTGQVDVNHHNRTASYQPPPSPPQPPTKTTAPTTTSIPLTIVNSVDATKENMPPTPTTTLIRIRHRLSPTVAPPEESESFNKQHSKGNSSVHG
ncbi:hypothetical protein PIB30_043293 [Stylosanthes scabra]|uniref:Uncharacterized protein n=1 Tax=Stylosanthes scabra TaxID=79078 RepID=A0ABU6YED6_9FABA|nr:hypothetical protein [Stylosanthes scabra]